MEYLVGLVLALLGGIFYFKGKADKAAVGARIAVTKAKDEALAEEEKLVEEAIQALNEAIITTEEKRKAELKKRKSMTLKERAEEAKNRYKK